MTTRGGGRLLPDGTMATHGEEPRLCAVRERRPRVVLRMAREHRLHAKVGSGQGRRSANQQRRSTTNLQEDSPCGGEHVGHARLYTPGLPTRRRMVARRRRRERAEHRWYQRDAGSTNRGDVATATAQDASTSGGEHVIHARLYTRPPNSTVEDGASRKTRARAETR